MISVCIHKLPHALELSLPEPATIDASGMDVRAAIDDQCDIYPGERCLIPTGLVLALPCGYEAQIRPRSGLAFKYGITVLNSPGTIDADYRGEIKILLINHGAEKFELKRGERIAQLIIVPTVKWLWQEEDDVTKLGKTKRGMCGYGSTGLD